MCEASWDKYVVILDYMNEIEIELKSPVVNHVLIANGLKDPPPCKNRLNLNWNCKLKLKANKQTNEKATVENKKQQLQIKHHFSFAKNVYSLFFYIFI